MRPSVATVAAVGIGAPVAGILSWLVDVIFGLTMPDHVEASFGVVIGALVGYFFRGGKAEDTPQSPAVGIARSSWLVTVLAALLTCAMLVSCASASKFIDENPAVARAGVQFAAAKLIRLAGDEVEQAKRRTRILNIAGEIEKEAQGVSVTIPALRSVALSYLPTDLKPEDRIVAGLLIDAVAEELLKRVGEGTLDADALLVLDKVLTWVAEGAVLTLPPGAPPLPGE